MEPVKEPLVDIESINLTDPKTPQQQEVTIAMAHAWVHMLEAWEECVSCGLLDSENKCQGLIAAISRLHAHSLLQFGINKLLPLSTMLEVAEVSCRNIDQELQINYPPLFAKALLADAEKETKQ